MLDIKNVSKKFDASTGIEDLDICLEEGRIYAFVGPNGAGKTTLIKCMAGLLSPGLGSILLNGTPTLKRETKRYIGYAIDSEDAYPKLKLIDLLDVISRLKFDIVDREEIKYYLERYELAESSNRFFSKLSMGTKKKAEMIMSFMGDPDLILLDEPTNGVDATGIIRIKEDILTAKKRGAIVVITSHMLDFLVKVADVCYFMDKGRLVDKVEVTEDSNLEETYKEIYKV